MAQDNSSLEPDVTQPPQSNQSTEHLPSIPLDAAGPILDQNLFDRRMTRWFKVTVFVLAISSGGLFLHSGLGITKSALEHIKEVQILQLAQAARQAEIAALKSETATPQASSQSAISNSAKTSNEATAQAEKKKASTEATSKIEPGKDKNHSDNAFTTAILSTGSIVTLIAFILGVGLTIILTTIKVIFTPQPDEQPQNNQNVVIAGPLTELCGALAEYLRSKIMPK